MCYYKIKSEIKRKVKSKLLKATVTKRMKVYLRGEIKGKGNYEFIKRNWFK